MKAFALLLLLPLAAHAQFAIYDYTSGPITSVQPIAVPGTTQPSGPPLGLDIYGIITLSAPLPANGTVSVTPNSVAFGITGGFGIVFESPALPVGPMTFTTTNGAVTGFDFNLSTPPSPYGIYSASGSSSTDTKIESDGGGFEASAASGSWYQPTPLPPGYGCIHATDTACEAINSSAPSNPSFTYQFYQPPSTAVPEIGSAGAGGALTLLAGMIAVVRGRKPLR